MMGVGPGMIEESLGRTGPEMEAGLECVGPALRPDQDLPISTCQPGFPEPTWTELGAKACVSHKSKGGFVQSHSLGSLAGSTMLLSSLPHQPR